MYVYGIKDKSYIGYLQHQKIAAINTYNMCLLSNTSIVDVHIYGMFHSTFSTCFRSVCTCMYMYMCVYVQNVSSLLQWAPYTGYPEMRRP